MSGQVEEFEIHVANNRATIRNEIIDEVADYVVTMHACYTDDKGNCLTISHEIYDDLVRTIRSMKQEDPNG